MRLSIRRANQADYEELCELFAVVDALHRKALPEVFRKAEGPARSKEFRCEAIENDDSALFVAERGGRLIGLVHALIQESRDIPILAERRYAVIENLVVAERFRRSGVGRALAEKAEQWASDKNVRQIQLNVWEFNQDAIAFYDRLGYTTASRKMWKRLS